MNIIPQTSEERKNEARVILSYVRYEQSKIIRTSESINNAFHNSLLLLNQEHIIYYAKRKFDMDFLKLCYNKIKESVAGIYDNWESFDCKNKPDFINNYILTLYEYLEIIKIDIVKEWIQKLPVDMKKVEYIKMVKPTDDDILGIIYKWVVETGMNEEIKKKIGEMFNLKFE